MFLEEYCFEPDEENPDAMGKLRTLTFTYSQMGEDGTPQQFTVECPVMSLFTMPILQIDEAELEYYIQILHHEYAGDASNSFSTDSESNAYLEQPVELLGNMVQHPEGSEGIQLPSRQMRVKMKIKQADIPAGVSSLLNIVNGSIQMYPT